ncbi:DUF4091 domain-containing protein [Bacillus niameyensis]|uniref:DUF4091 domain-containing protein n=1 Tax=Bacillus niameyensis TaxID=1522308 RepID=UPI00078372E8|nr:DUF4091 domain-containing protein [Bacillus niameyensis]
MSKIEFQLADSLEKVFPDNSPKEFSLKEPTLFQNEQFSFQLAYRSEGENSVQIRIVADDSILVSVSKVKKVPSDLPAYPDRHDENYLSTEPGLYPDFLEPVIDGKVELETDGWNAIWLDVKPDSQISGEKAITIKVLDEKGEDLYEGTVNIRIIHGSLPEQKLIRTEWFHADCLADYYQIEAFSEEHWRIVENFIKTASENGINMILTPVFTQPLDTQVGGERTTVQLVDISLENGQYTFDFSQLKRWLEICGRHDIKYLEIAHLFTQWGAAFTPKILVKEDGQLTKRFGWHVASDSVEYQEFLQAFLPALTDFLQENWQQENVYFHISDEPYEGNLETYSKAKSIAAPYLEGFKIMDALSNYSFYERGIVQKPVVATNHIQPFLDHKVPGLWAYYCCSQNVGVSNRFMAMPSARNRIIATQLFKFDIEGFLQWGYNFYNSQYSIEPINPYEVTDAKKAFPSGDAFLVYPGKNGEALPSIRSRVFFQAMQDLRALQWLEELKGKQFVLELIEKKGEITFSEYPKESGYIFNMREEVNREIEKALVAESV